MEQRPNEGTPHMGMQSLTQNFEKKIRLLETSPKDTFSWNPSEMEGIQEDSATSVQEEPSTHPLPSNAKTPAQRRWKRLTFHADRSGGASSSPALAVRDAKRRRSMAVSGTHTDTPTGKRSFALQDTSPIPINWGEPWESPRGNVPTTLPKTWAPRAQLKAKRRVNDSAVQKRSLFEN